jgi:hypothetical protein
MEYKYAHGNLLCNPIFLFILYTHFVIITDLILWFVALGIGTNSKKVWSWYKFKIEKWEC